MLFLTLWECGWSFLSWLEVQGPVLQKYAQASDSGQSMQHAVQVRVSSVIALPKRTTLSFLVWLEWGCEKYNQQVVSFAILLLTYEKGIDCHYCCFLSLPSIINTQSSMPFRQACYFPSLLCPYLNVIACSCVSTSDLFADLRRHHRLKQ